MSRQESDSLLDHGHFREDGVRRRRPWSLIAIYKTVQTKIYFKFCNRIELPCSVQTVVNVLS